MQSRALNILSSSFINIQRISINNSDADYNNLVYISETKDLSILSFNITNIRK